MEQRRDERVQIEDKVMWLERYRDLQRECKYARNQIERIDTRLGVHGIRSDGMPRGKGGVHDAMADAVVELVAARHKLQELEMDSARAMRQIIDWITAIADPHIRGILMRRYISGWTWQRIGTDMELDETTVRRHHNDFLEGCGPVPEKPEIM